MPPGGFPEGGQLQQAHGLRWRDGSDRDADTVYFDQQGNFVVRVGAGLGAFGLPGGAMLRSGSGAPPATLGTNGDFYFDSSGGSAQNQWQKITGSWNLPTAGAAASAAPAGPAGGVLTGTFPNPILANLSVTTAAFAAGAVTGTAVASDIQRWAVNALGRNVVWVPSGATASGVNLAASTMSSRGGGAMVWETATYNMDLPIELYSQVHHYGNGSTINPTGSQDAVRTFNFDSLSLSAATTFSGAPWGYSFRNFTVSSATLGRHCIASFGMNYVLEDLLILNRGQGSALWEEYGTNSEDWLTGPHYERGDTSTIHRGITISDLSTASTNVAYAPTACDMSLGIRAVINQNNPIVKTVFPHLLTQGMAISIVGAGGAAGINGSWSVGTIVDPYQFMLTTGSPGVFTSGGHTNQQVSAAWTFLGPHDSSIDHVYMYEAGTVPRGRRGALFGGNGNGSSTGAQIDQFHVYNNFDVGLDIISGGFNFGGSTEVEGSYACCVMCRTNGRVILPPRIYAGHGGVTLLSLRSSGQNTFFGHMEKGGSGEAPPAGFYNTYIESVPANQGNTIYATLEHDFDTACAVTAGSMPINGFTRVIMQAYGLSTASFNVGWTMSINANTSGIIINPPSLTATTA